MHNNIKSYWYILNHIILNQCSFRKGFGAQNCLLYIIETIRKTRNNHGVFAAVMTDLSKTFDCIYDELLVAKLNAYGFDETSLKVIMSYLKNLRKLLK